MGYIDMYEIEEYVREDGTSPFAEWLGALKDTRARMRLLARIDRVSLGNLGDWRALSNAEGIAELRDPYGPGYRLYFSFVGKRIVLLLAGSTKRDQRRPFRAQGRIWETTGEGPNHESKSSFP